MTEEELIQLLVLENASELSKVLEEPRYWGADMEQRRQARGNRILEILRQTAFPDSFRQDVQLLLLMAEPELVSDDELTAGFTTTNWLDLLLVHPELAEHCDCRQSFDHWERAELLSRHPQLFRYWPPDSYSGGEIVRLLGKSPEWIECFESVLHRLTGNHWRRLLNKQPDLWTYCRKHGKLDHKMQRLLLEQNIGFESECDCWNEFNAADWSELLSRYPHLRSRCETKNWSSRNWATVSAKVPTLISECPCLVHFTENEWALILVRQPQFAEQCDRWELFSEHNWQMLLLNQPQLLDRCPYPLTPPLQAALIASGSEVPAAIDWKAFGPVEWWMVVRKRPELIEHCFCWDALPEDVRINLILKQPALKERFGDSDDVPEIWKRCLNIRHPER
ncbi:hypothetical protein [Victivallis sp. Marseille-Q1083]|uniref:hypothetical protein n=1 Tax=Victivallis sp. Marseille-Q1083 TaxID=2717288 RepID=UPI00158D507C|nr:hypothetical protein [Victivallis sp. Marseille-Q1083]